MARVTDQIISISEVMEAQLRFRVTISGKGHNKSVEIDTDSCVLGRGKECDIVIDDDLVSRKHLKISMKNNEIVIEELGSTNGTWINNAKIEKGKKIPYTSETKVFLGGANGLSLNIENLALQSNLLNITAQNTIVKISSEKKLIQNLDTLKVANGSVEPISYAVSTPNSPVENRNIKLVAGEVTLKDFSKKSLQFPEKKADSKKSLDNKLKQLVNQESDRMREKSLKEADQIKQKALEEEKNIHAKAKKDALEIIERSKEEAARNKEEAEKSILLLKEKIKNSEYESELSIKNLKNNITQLEEKISGLRQIESGHNQKMKQFEDEYAGIKERIRNENLLLEELKHQSNTVKKNAELKLEEVVLQERRSRAKLETEIAEAKNQTAKIFSEAEKAQALKELLDPEILELKNVKIKIEKEINDAHTRKNKLELDYDKANNSFHNLLAQTDEARVSLEEVYSKIRTQQDVLSLAQIKFEEKEKAVLLKIEQSEQSALLIIENANVEAKKIAADAQLKSQKAQEQNAKSIKDMEAQKVRFNEELETDRKSKLKDIQHELELLKNSHSQELEKLEIKKNSLVNEMKWLESNAAATCDKIVAQAKKEAQDLKEQTYRNIELLKATAKNEVQNLKDRAQKEIQSSKENIAIEIQNLKKEAVLEVANLKNAVVAEAARAKIKADEEFAKLRNDILSEQEKISAEAASIEDLKMNLRLSIERSDKMMEDHHILAEQQIRIMLENAQRQALAIENEAKEQKAHELASLVESKKSEAERVEELKIKFEEYKVSSKNEMATSIAETVQEFLAIEMIKSRNLILDEKLIKKISDKSKKIVTDATLGRLQASANGFNQLFKTKRTDYSGILKIVITLFIVVGTLYTVKTYPVQSAQVVNAIRDFFTKLDVTLP
jgi:pSer/pThr/pTyr-binding forkhead associated (FHA) protein